jgi:hypothetical protein
VHSRQGTALARRIGQLARGFASRNWRVSVVHRLQQPQDPAANSQVTEPTPAGAAIRRRAIGGGGDATSNRSAWLVPFRKLATLWVALSHGDPSGRWAYGVERLARSGVLRRPDLILACFTPRGPLRAAERLHRFWGVPWIADLQDPWWEGSSGALRPIVATWMRRVLRSAALVVQVSPEWAASDARTLRRSVETQRHAIPAIPLLEHAAVRESNGRLVVLYAGSLDEDCQDLNPFMDALAQLHNRGERGIELRLAATEAVWRKFATAAQRRGVSEALRWLGWLTDADLQLAAQHADCLLLIPWFSSDRRGVPSKLYEYLAFGRPTLIAGTDSGGIVRVLGEWGHPMVVADTATKIVDALLRARSGDFSGMLLLLRCSTPPLSEEAFVEWYVERACAIVPKVALHPSAHPQVRGA